MENDLCSLLSEAKFDENKMVQALDLFTPLINKFAEKLFFMDKEDAEQEMKLAFIISVQNISYFHSQGECIAYIKNGLYHRFCVLCRDNYKNKEELIGDNQLHDCRFEERYNDIDIIYNYEKKLAKMPPIYTKIFRLLLEEYSDKEIGTILHLSKQYINRIKKKIVPVKNFN